MLDKSTYLYVFDYIFIAMILPAAVAVQLFLRLVDACRLPRPWMPWVGSKLPLEDLSQQSTGSLYLMETRLTLQV